MMEESLMKTTNRNMMQQVPGQTSSRSSSGERIYLMEARNGLLVRVPESKLAAWEEAQRNPKNDPESVAIRQRLADRIVQSIYRK